MGGNLIQEEEDKHDQTDINRPLRLLSSITNTRKSSLIEQYKTLLNLTDVLPLDNDELIQLFQHHNIDYDPTVFKQQIQILVEEHTLNYQTIKATVKYGHFNTHVSIINIDEQSPLKCLGEGAKGSYGDVYKFTYNSNSVAIKSIKITEEKFQVLLRQAIKQYMFLMIANALKVGPALFTIFGFDLVIFTDNLCFSMQFCDMGHSKIFWKEFQTKLHLLHRLHIVHLDIKPENLGFSSNFNQFVFIDFGLSRMIKEEIGQQTPIKFTGSMSFCSQEMLQLFVKDDCGKIDIYFNDATCLSKSKVKIQQQAALFDDQDEVIVFRPKTSKVNWRWFREYSLNLTIKHFLFQLACGDRCKTQNFEAYSTFAKKNIYKMSDFIQTLPRTQQLLHIIHNVLKIKSNFDEPQLFSDYSIFHKHHDNFEESSAIFINRFSIIEAINDSKINNNPPQSHPKGEMEFFLLDQRQIKQSNFQIYKLVLAKFIRINSHHRNFKTKIKACQIFNETYMKVEPTSDMNLYRDTVTFLFMGTLESLDRINLQIIRNLVETVVILDLVPGQTLCEILKRVLWMEISLDIAEQLTILIQFLASMEFAKQKYRTNFIFSNLSKIFFGEAHRFIEAKWKSNFISQSYEIFKILKHIICRKIYIDDNQYTKNQHIFSIFTQRKSILPHKALYQAIEKYVICQLIYDQTEKYNSAADQLIRKMMIWINRKLQRQKRMSYAHLTLWNAFEKINEQTSKHYVYRLICEQLQEFEELKYFNLYLYSKLQAVKKIFAQQDTLNKYEPITQNQTNNPQLFPIYSYQDINQVFQAMDYIVKNNYYFHKYVSWLIIKPPAVKYNSPIAAHTAKLFLQNQQKVTKISQVSVGNHIDHDKTLRFQIYVISKIIQYMSPFLSNQKCISAFNQFLQQCQIAVAQTACLECKVHALLLVNEIKANCLHIQGHLQESFLTMVEIMIFYLKNSQTFKNDLDFIAPLVRRWSTFLPLFQRYSIQEFLYDFIKATGNYFCCLMDIPQYNLFSHLYIYIAKTFTEEEIINFVLAVAKKLKTSRSPNSINYFYYSIIFIIQEVKHLSLIEEFKEIHDKIIDSILSQENLNGNPYVILYIYALLENRVIAYKEGRMLKAISLLMKHVDKYCRKRVLDGYYEYFLLYQLSPYRKQKFLSSLHLKFTSNLYSLKRILQIKNDNLAANQQSDEKSMTLKKHIRYYHQNIGNKTWP